MLLSTGGPAVVHSVAYPLFAVIGYLAGLIFLIVFGIWGFRLARRSAEGGNGDGGSGPPDLSPGPPQGGRELADGDRADREVADDFAAWEEQFGTPESKPAPTRRVGGPPRS